MESKFRVIYQWSGATALRMLNILCVAFGVGGLGLAAYLSKAPPVILHGESTRWGWVLGMGLFAIACPIASWLYTRRMARQILLSADGATLRVYESGLMGNTPRDIAVRDAQIDDVTQGDAAGEENFGPSRFHVQVRGRRGFIVSFNKGAQAQREALARVLARQ